MKTLIKILKFLIRILKALFSIPLYALGFICLVLMDAFDRLFQIGYYEEFGN